MPIAPPSTPLAQGIGEYPSEIATATSLKRSLAARTWSARVLRASPAEAVPNANSDKVTRLLAHEAAINLFSRVRFQETAVSQPAGAGRLRAAAEIPGAGLKGFASSRTF